jgi:ABC-type transport system involved in multi-copper enzyme maturation permease subunit
MSNVFITATLVIKEMCRRKDFYVLLILTVLITGLMASVSLFHDHSIIRYIKEVCLLLIWISSLAIAIGAIARQIPAEFESRTIFPLLAKPVTRAQFVIGKFLGCWLACGFALFVFYLFFACVSFSREHHWHLVNYFQAVVLHWFVLAVLIAFSLLGSLVFAAPSSNATISLVAVTGILMVGRHINKVALQMDGFGRAVIYSIYYLIPHLEIFDVRDLLIHNWPPIRWGMLGIALLYALFYTALFLAGACLLFRRKSLINP